MYDIFGQLDYYLVNKNPKIFYSKYYIPNILTLKFRYFQIY